MNIKLVALSLFAFLALAVMPPPAQADDLADAKSFIGKQVELIKKGDVAGLKAGFSKRQQERVTADAVKRGAEQVGKMTLDDLVASAAPNGKDTLKIKMKNGRTLTTLIKEDGHWVADTIWFK